MIASRKYERREFSSPAHLTRGEVAMEKLAEAADAHVRREAHVPKAIAVEPPVDVASESKLIEQDLLVEDVSIDGMCGVY
jgi:mycofactocin precursor